MSDNEVAMFFYSDVYFKNYKGLTRENVEKRTNLVNFFFFKNVMNQEINS